MQKNNATLSQNEKVLLALKNFKFDSEEEDEKEEKEASYSNYDDSEKKIGNNQEEYEAPSVNSSEFNAKPILESKYPKLKSASNISNIVQNKTFGLKNPEKDIKKSIRPTTSSSKNLPKPNEKSFLKNTSVSNLNGLERPKTSYKGKENVRFQPVYTESYNNFLINNKCFNYKDKKFITVAKKTDIVSKFQNLKKGWEKTKFLKSNSTTGKEGRKLNLAERINNDRPEEMFYRYVPKSGLY